MIKAILMGIVVMLLTVLMDRSFLGEDLLKKVNDDGKEYTRFNTAGFDNSVTWTRAIGYGAAVGVLAFARTLAWWLAPICLLGMMALMLQYAWWWGFAGNGRLKALIWFLLIQWVFQSVAADAVRQLLTIDVVSGNKFLAFVVQVLPTVVGALCNGSAIVGACKHCDKKGLATFFTWLAVIGIILTVCGGFATVADGINLNAAKSQIVNNAAEETAEFAPLSVEPTNQQKWYTFYNLLIQDDGLLNDNDFGPNPYEEEWWTMEYANDMLARIKNDPVLGAADIAYFDHVAGTTISGVKYDSDPEKWLANINARAVEFVRDQELYTKVVDEFIRTLNSNIVQGVDIESRNNAKHLMYMDPNNTANIGGYGYFGSCSIRMPKVIMKSHNESAWFLVFKVKNGSSTGEAIYKLACGYQPPIEAAGSTGTGGGSGGPAGPIGGKLKDPTKGTDVGRNDDDGPGTNTNTGKGSRTSASDTPTGSTSGTYDDYRKAMEGMPANQPHSGGPNTPSTTPPPGSNMDDNGRLGTGSGGADDPTKVTGPATGANTGKPITTDPAGEWGGPPD